MAEIWSLKARLRCWLQLGNSPQPIELRWGQPGEGIFFGAPQEAPKETPGWESVEPLPAWDYDVTIRFEAATPEEAQALAWRRLERLAARLSFAACAPVKVLYRGSLTNAPETPVEGVDYLLIITPDQQFAQRAERLTIVDQDLPLIGKLLAARILSGTGTDRIDRSLRWLQSSHFASTPADEFVCLMLAFEAISHLLKPGTKRYWHCDSCDRDVQSCPQCGASTEWAGSGNLAMQEFVIQKLGWNKEQWREAWKQRNLLFHGTQDLSHEQQGEIAAQLGPLETAVVTALKVLLRLPPNAPPRAVCQRNPFFDAMLRITWHTP
jgi:hypothetical protein